MPRPRHGRMGRPRTESSRSVLGQVSQLAFTDPCCCVLFVCVCVQDLGRRLREAESLAQQAQPKLAARDREIQVVCRGWR